MRYYILFALLLVTKVLRAQTAPQYMFETWVTSKVVFRDGTELPDAHPLKNVYIKYRFSRPNKVNVSSIYTDYGNAYLFQVDNSLLTIKNDEGWVVNTYRTEITNDTLVLLQAGRKGFNDPDALKFYFVQERSFQNSLALEPADILKVFERDTIYKQTPKIYAVYRGESFRNDMYKGVREDVNMDNRVGNLLATFIVSKTGSADSLKILEGIDADYNKTFVKVFKQNRKKWEPALLNGKPVAVQMSVNLSYLTSETAIPALLASQKANQAFTKGNYELALYYFDKAIASKPHDKEDLYLRALCKLLLGNKDGACEDWNKAKALGSWPALDEMLKKYCL
ncbi:hypothetical protein [Mucilaginibacter auburnensis]|uniref:Tetratricopeptide repeat protein n=1 Tax=Mucilaginibacter auburnensis TaxID=1457233 RepID=A0A2H9VQH3_9SPHI|nr:hypothetical protein [Mucilaginibacter auburnensis]PJJ83107.1 hypothetical protein CLV57_0085 [Mucilaginibacter auburnensis]